MRTLLCPGDIITYTCALSSGFGIISTLWTGSPGFQCPSFGGAPAALTQPAGASLNTVPGSCGTLSAVMTNISGTCYASVLTIPTPQYFNRTTVTCRDGFFGTLIGNDTLNIQLASPSNVQPSLVCTISLTLQWTMSASDNAAGYVVLLTTTSGTTLAMNTTTSTMTTIGDLIDGTSYTVSVAAINCAGSSNNNSVSVQTYTYCTSNSCLYIIGMSGAYVSSYNVSVACRNTRNQTGQPYVAMQSVPNPVVLKVDNIIVSGNTATIPCTFLDGSSHYCMVCCSPSVPVGLAGSGYLSTTNGPSVSVSLQGLTSGQMYYCKAAATNTNSNNCTGPVVGGVKVFFSFMTSPVPITSSSPSMSTPPPSPSCGVSIGTSTAVGISVAMTFILSFTLGGLVIAIIICGCYNPRRFSSKTTKPPPPVPTTTATTYEVVGFNKKEGNTIELESNSAYETGRH
eukprot:Em0006g173a